MNNNLVSLSNDTEIYNFVKTSDPKTLFKITRTDQSISYNDGLYKVALKKDVPQDKLFITPNENQRGQNDFDKGFYLVEENNYGGKRRKSQKKSQKKRRVRRRGSRRTRR